jgi:hypothetical protein
MAPVLKFVEAFPAQPERGVFRLNQTLPFNNSRETIPLNFEFIQISFHKYFTGERIEESERSFR